MLARTRPNVSAFRRPAQAVAIAAFAAIQFASSAAFSQETPPPGFTPQPPPPADPGYDPSQPPPGAYPPPPGAYPPGYPPPPGYGYNPYAPPPASVAPWTLDYEDGDPIPPGYHVDTRIRKGLVIGGAVTLGTTWLITCLTGAILTTAFGDEFAPLFAPVAGPFITIGTAQASGGGLALLAVDGVIQTGGLAMLIVGIAVPKTVLIRNDASAPSFQVTPMMVGKGTMGLGIVGQM
jgi:hypothetical protein